MFIFDHLRCVWLLYSPVGDVLREFDTISSAISFWESGGADA